MQAVNAVMMCICTTVGCQVTKVVQGYEEQEQVLSNIDTFVFGVCVQRDA